MTDALLIARIARRWGIGDSGLWTVYTLSADCDSLTAAQKRTMRNLTVHQFERPSEHFCMVLEAETPHSDLDGWADMMTKALARVGLDVSSRLVSQTPIETSHACLVND